MQYYIQQLMFFSIYTYPHTKVIGFEIYKYNYTNVYEI